jgi:hypothetical protein
MPERISNAGDSTDPQATTTVGASTVSAVVEPSAWVTVPATPVARPSSTVIRSTAHATTARAPESDASCSQVFIAERLQPCWQPIEQ